MSHHIDIPQRIRWLVAGLVAAFAALLLSAMPAAASKGLLDVAAGAPTKRVEVIVQMRRGKRVADGKSEARKLQAGGVRDTPLINGFVVTMPAGNALALKKRPGVHAVTLNSRVRSTAVNTSRLQTIYPLTTQAPSVWNSLDLNVTGRGVGVAVIDSGVAGDYPDFASAPGGSSRVVANAVINPLATNANDVVGHGTHVAGIIAGNGNSRDDADLQRGRYIGIAPEANIVAVKVGDDVGEATILDVINGLQFAVDHQAEFNLRVVNLSLASTVASNPATDPLAAAAESAWMKGLVVVSAAGNLGAGPGAVDYAPANDPYVITVGGTDQAGTRQLNDDFVAPWSSRGVTAGGVAKPEVYAPGVRLVSALAPGSMFSWLCPACITSGTYIRASGTSMSAPVVSGIVALMLEKNPSLTPNQVKGVLLSTARGFNGGLAASAPDAVRAATQAPYPVANAGLVPNNLVDPATGDIDYNRSSWSRSSWSSAPDSLSAGWARSSWSCTTCGNATPVAVDPTRSSWSRSSWSNVILAP